MSRSENSAIPDIGVWIINKGKIPVAECRAYAKQFNPTTFNADAISSTIVVKIKGAPEVL